MTFLTYAQNFEDVLLWRALGHIKNGFYIDVGANDPVEHSVTKAFYDAGWHGVNIEPLPSFHQKFLDQRPRDINLAIAAGASEGNITLFDVPAVNGWASPDAAVAEAHKAEGFDVTEMTVPMRTLASVCADHVSGDIHFLKVDVEGFEGEVLRGMDFVKYRPWVLVIEATLPNSRVTNHEQWENLVTSRGYQFAHFDGLNRYYVADEHQELVDVLSIQPNVFDEFISWHLDNAWKANEAALEANQRADERARIAADKQWHAEKRADDAHGVAQQALEQSSALLLRYEDAMRQVALTVSEREAFRGRLERRDQDLQDLELRMAEQAQAASDAAASAAARLAEHDRMAYEREKDLHAQLAQRDQAYAELGAAAHHAQAWGRDLEQRLLATYASTSWRVTAPLRWLRALPRRLAAPETRARARAMLRSLAVRMTSNERLRRLIIPVLLRFPEQAAQVQQVLREIKQPDAAPVAPAPATAQLSDEERAMPASARKVLAALQRARSHTTGT